MPSTTEWYPRPLQILYLVRPRALVSFSMWMPSPQRALLRSLFSWRLCQASVAYEEMESNTCVRKKGGQLVPMLQADILVFCVSMVNVISITYISQKLKTSNELIVKKWGKFKMMDVLITLAWSLLHTHTYTTKYFRIPSDCVLMLCIYKNKVKKETRVGELVKCWPCKHEFTKDLSSASRTCIK